MFDGFLFEILFNEQVKAGGASNFKLHIERNATYKCENETNIKVKTANIFEANINDNKDMIYNFFILST